MSLTEAVVWLVLFATRIRNNTQFHVIQKDTALELDISLKNEKNYISQSIGKI